MKKAATTGSVTGAGQASVTAPRRAGTERRKWLILLAMVFGLFTPLLDNLVVNVALPTIQARLGAGVSGLQWIVDAYTLTFAAFMLTGGTLGDLYGRKRVFMIGLGVFAAASVIAGLAGSTGELIAARALQGVGAALLLPVSLSIISATFSGRERGAAIGIWGAVAGLAIAIGPLVGGYLVEHVSWQSIFFVNAPVGLAGLAMTARVVPESRDERRSRRLDPPGLALATIGLLALTYGLIEGNARGWTDELILGSFAVAAALLVAFFAIQARRSAPMVPLAFFRNRTFSGANAVAALMFFALFGVVFFLTLYLQNVRGYAPAAAGLRLFPFSAMILVVAPLAGKLSDRVGSRGLMTVGPLVTAAGLALLLQTQPEVSYPAVLLPAFLVMGAGWAMAITATTAAVLGSVEDRKAGVASAVTNTSRELGGVLGIAALGALVTAVFNRGFLASLTQAGIPRGQAVGIVAATGKAAVGGASGQDVDGPVLGAAQQAFIHAIHVGIGVAITAMVLAAALSWLLVRSHVASRQSATTQADPT